jgi:hypothetical protein
MKRFTARRLRAVLVGFVIALGFAGPILPVLGQWSSARLDDGSWGCVHAPELSQLTAGYPNSQSTTTIVCKGWNRLLSWIGTAEAANFRIAVGAIVPGPGGEVNTSCRDGSCAPTTVAWTAGLATAMQAVVSRTTGDGGVDIDLSAYCTGANCASAVYRLHTAVTGWSVAGSGTKHLLNNGMSVGDWSTLGALVLDVCFPSAPTCNASSSFSWAYSAAGPSDTTIPDPVTNLTVTGVNTSEVDVSFNASIDPDDGVTRSGIAQYCYYRNSVLLSCDAASSAGLVNDWTGENVGSPMGTGFCTQSGASWSLRGLGAGVEQTTTDSYYGCVTSVSGASTDVVVSFGAIPNAATYNKFGCEFVAADTNNAVSDEFHVLRIGSTYSIESTPRNSVGAARHTNLSSQIGTTQPNALQLHIDASGFDASYSFDGGATFVPGVTNYTTAVIPTTKYVRCFGTATSNGVTIDIPINWMHVSVDPTITKQLTGVASGTATFQATAKDTVGNEATKLTGVSATPLAPPSSQTNLHAGQYAALDFNTSKANQLAQIATYCNNSALTGFKLYVAWAQLESATLGDYTAGIAYVQDFVTAAHNCGKYLMVEMRDHIFGSPYSSPPTIGQLSPYFPAYLMTSTYGPCCGATNGSGATTTYTYGGVIVAGAGTNSYPRSASIDTYPPVVDRMLALDNAYGAVFDGQLESFGWTESADFFVTNVAGGDYSGKITGHKRLIAAWAAAWPHTMYREQLNFLQNDSQILDVMNYCFAHTNCVVGGPDPQAASNQSGLQAAVVFTGTRCTGCVAHDFRTDGLLLIGETQDDGMAFSYAAADGGDSGTDPFAESTVAIQTSYKNTYHAPFMIWFTGGYSSQYMLGTFAKVITQLGVDHSVYALACPPNFPGGCKTN